jgi:hypothetical protein
LTPSPSRAFDLSPSLPYAAVILAAHAAAGLALMAMVAGVGGAALALLVVVLGVLAARQHALLRAAGSPRRVLLDADGRARLELRDGRSVLVSPDGPRRVTRFWVVLPTGRLSAVLLTRDMPGAANFRHLCVWSLWGQLSREMAGNASRALDTP